MTKDESVPNAIPVSFTSSATPSAGPVWPSALPVRRVRVARPTARLDEVVAFYVDVLGLPRLGGFEGHDGYDGVFVGLPSWEYHLEFTRHVEGSPCPAPTRDNLLVLYLNDPAAVEAMVRRVTARGYEPIEPENPYWEKTGAVTIEDPDGWRIVFAVAST
ncbi:VOC family protein [Pendulispora rubella]|uniref:VOC family protein n=1 Tax=Pendulispora rubella TaxID=2741070 RepID=A0ABZ2LDN1_9BACT